MNQRIKEDDPGEVMFSVGLPLEEEEVAWGRDYRLNALPRDASGTVLYSGPSDAEYFAYVEWLEDYLYKVRFRPGREQAAICSYLAGYETEFAIQLLAMNAVSYDIVMAGVELYITDPETEEEGYYTKEQIQRAKREKRQMIKYGITEETKEDFCDIGWRIPLASLLKKIPEKDERVRLVRFFFQVVQEYFLK